MRGSDAPGPVAAGAFGDALPERPRGRPRWRGAVAVLAGWGFAAAVWLQAEAPAAGSPGAPSLLALAAVAAFWPLALWVVRSDLADFLIPDGASAALAALGLGLAAGLGALGVPPGAASGSALGAALASASGAAATGAGAFAIFWAVGAIFRALGRDALGHGDVKLAGALAVWLSPADAALALELAALAAALALAVSRRAGPLHDGALHDGQLHDGPLRDAAVPFGAFMAPAAWLVLVLAPGLRLAGWLPDAGWLAW